MIAAIAQHEVVKTLEELNHRNIFEIEVYAPTSVNTVQKELESKGNYTHILLELRAFRNNVDAGLDLLERLKHTQTHSTMIAFVEGLWAESADYQDICDMGINDIITTSGAGLKKQFIDILLRDKVLSSSGASLTAESWLADENITPPSQVARTDAKAAMIPKPPPKNIAKSTVVACAGIGSRIGTTTQAMQLALFLHGMGVSVAVVQMNPATSSLEEYIEVLGVTESDDTKFVVNGLTIFRGSNAISLAKSSFNYVVCDYGDYLALPDKTVFLDKDIKVIVAGIKPWESRELKEIFMVDDGSIYYIFSFVPTMDYKLVKEQMLESAGKTFFSPYAPDYWQYSGADDLYSSIVPINPPHETAPGKSKGLRGLFSFNGK